MQKIEPVLAPENLALHHIAGGTKHPGFNGRLCVAFIGCLCRGLARLCQTLGRQTPLGQQLGQYSGIGNVALFGPDGTEDGAGNRQRSVRPVVLVHGHDQTPGIVTDDRIEYKFASGSAGGIDTTIENAGKQRGRQSWREIQ